MKRKKGRRRRDITPQEFADQLDEQEREEEQRAHRERIDMIAWRKQQERRDLERQRADTVEVSSGEEGKVEDTPQDYDRLFEWLQKKTLEELIALRMIQKCDSCERMSFVKRNTEAGYVYHPKCQVNGCSAHRPTSNPFLVTRFEVEWPYADTNEGYRGRKKSQLPCLNFLEGRGCDRGNECHLSHGHLEDARERNRCFMCGRPGHHAKNCTTPAGKFYENKHARQEATWKNVQKVRCLRRSRWKRRRRWTRGRSTKVTKSRFSSHV